MSTLTARTTLLLLIVKYYSEKLPLTQTVVFKREQGRGVGQYSEPLDTLGLGQAKHKGDLLGIKRFLKIKGTSRTLKKMQLVKVC